MEPVKAALESSVRYLAAGALKTRAASGIDHFNALLSRCSARARAASRHDRGNRLDHRRSRE
jgi:enoyl-[acyl-carrier protein] reductase I